MTFFLSFFKINIRRAAKLSEFEDQLFAKGRMGSQATDWVWVKKCNQTATSILMALTSGM